ncbi:DUF7848 domain-containing protein [Streptomyces sp. NPDC054796]
MAVSFQAVCMTAICDGHSEESVTAEAVSTWMHAHEAKTGHQVFRRLVTDTESIQSSGQPKPATPLPAGDKSVKRPLSSDA